METKLTCARRLCSRCAGQEPGRRVEAPRSSGSRTRENKELMQRVAKLKGPKPEEWAAR
jgi:hypothetical protein